MATARSTPAQPGGQNINNMQAAVDQNTTTNRMYAPNDPNHTLIDYDAVGNQTKDYYDWNGTRVYDAENRMATASNGVTDGYSYDGGGKRVRRNIAGAETWQVYGLGGELIAEYAANASSASPQKEYGYRNGQLLISAAAAQSQQSTENVVWTGAANVTVNSNSITKSAGTADLCG